MFDLFSEDDTKECNDTNEGVGSNNSSGVGGGGSLTMLDLQGPPLATV